MSFLTTLFLYLGAIVTTALAGYSLFMAILREGNINRLTIVLGIVAGVLWTVIGVGALWNFILNSTMAQFVLLVVFVMIIILNFDGNSSKKPSKKGGKKRK